MGALLNQDSILSAVLNKEISDIDEYPVAIFDGIGLSFEDFGNPFVATITITIAIRSLVPIGETSSSHDNPPDEDAYAL